MAFTVVGEEPGKKEDSYIIAIFDDKEDFYDINFSWKNLMFCL